MRALYGAIAALLISYLLLFVSDRVWDTPRPVRMLLLGVGLGTAVFQMLFRRPLRQRGFSPIQENDLAELARCDKRPIGYRVAEADVILRTQKHAVPVLLTLAMAALVVLPEASRSTFLRWLLPISQVPRFTFVQIEDLPEELFIAHGEPFELHFSVAYQSFWHPKTLTASFPEESSYKATVNNGRATFQLSEQTEQRPLTLKVGDFSLRVRITPLHRPVLTEVAALVTPPPYLQRPPMAIPIRNGEVHVIGGSRIVLKGLASRSLRRACLNGSTRLSVAGSMILTEEFDVSNDEEITLTWEDWYGLKAQNPTHIKIIAQSDQPPEIAIRNLGRVVAMQEADVLNLELSAGDDFGLKDVGLCYEIYSAGNAKNIAYRKRAVSVKKGNPKTDCLSFTFSFSPSTLDIPPATLVKLRATARDFLPERKATLSQEHQILVLGEVEDSKSVPKEFAGLLVIPGETEAGR